MKITAKFTALLALLSSSAAYAASPDQFAAVCCALGACCGLPCC
jgi:hypothetical protein